MSEAILKLKREEFVHSRIPLAFKCGARRAGAIAGGLGNRMLRVFAGRMDSFKFMLSNKNIALHIEDLVQVSEFAAPLVDEDQESGNSSSVAAAYADFFSLPYSGGKWVVLSGYLLVLGTDTNNENVYKLEKY